MQKGLHYFDYLGLDKILSAQELESDKFNKHAHDEMLFIITHQAFELWFKQVLFDVDSVISLLSQQFVPEKDISICYQRMGRVKQILTFVTGQFEILETMTPLNFTDFRNFLNPASGFQSFQFRLLETKLGLPNDTRVNKHFENALKTEDLQQLESARNSHSLFSAIEQWLENMPFLQLNTYSFSEEYKQTLLGMIEKDKEYARELIESTEEYLKRIQQIDILKDSFLSLFDETLYQKHLDDGSRRLSFKATQAYLFISLYADFPLLQLPFLLLQTVIEVDNALSVWRYHHFKMVSKMIGKKIGTGGSSGSDYLLRTVAAQRVFDDLGSLASFLVARDTIPPLPDEIAHQLRFAYEIK